MAKLDLGASTMTPWPADVRPTERVPFRPALESCELAEPEDISADAGAVVLVSADAGPAGQADAIPAAAVWLGAAALAAVAAARWRGHAEVVREPVGVVLSS